MAAYELPHVKQNYWEMDGCRQNLHSISISKHLIIILN